MWPFKDSPRRLAMRADATEAQSAKRIAVRHLGPALTIAGVFFFLATAILYYPSDRVPYRVGEKAPIDLRSPVDITVEDPLQTQRDRDAARANTGAVLVPDLVALGQIRSHLMNLPEDVRSAAAVNQLPVEIVTRWPGLSNGTLQWLHQVQPDVYHGDVETLLAALTPLPLVDQETADRITHQQSELVYVAEAGTVERPLRTLMRRDVMTSRPADPAQRKELRDFIANKNGAFPIQMADVLVDYLLQSAPPTYRYSAVEHEKLALRQAAAVKPAGLHIRKGELIAAHGEEITAAIRQQLAMAQKEYESEVGSASPWLWLLAHAGEAMGVLFITLIGTLYVTQMNQGLNTASRGWSLVGLLLVTLFVAKGSVSTGLYHAVYMLGVAPTLLTTIILVIAFNQRFALVISSLHALLVTLALGMDAQFFMVMLTGITVFTFGLKEIRTRGKLIEMGVFASAALLVCVWALGMARLVGSVWTAGTLASADISTFIQTLALNSLWAAAAGVGVGFVTLGILPFIERMFKITTAMTLLELCDLNQPLLKRLSQEAAGTFNHSLVVGTLAEAAGNAIGANGLLCRVGAYYHDIGKLSKPQYFIENQSGGPNRHEKLSPAMSLLIIVGHVKDGVELAREYHLPWIVHQFIAQHHGTTLVEYFYHAARERMTRQEESSGNNDAGNVTEAEFRYAGPKPQTRETAILMICDGVESMVRSLAEPTSGRIETSVHQMVMKRLMDGQFAQCDLTLRDLSLIEQSLVYTLAGVYHGRVAYPKPLAVSRPA